MSNQVILWISLIAPWLTLFLMPRESIKRYLPTGLLVTVLSIIFTEIGIANGWWAIRETTYPLALIPSYTYGAFPVLSMWILKFLYGRFKIFVVTEVVMNILLSFVIYPWIAGRGIKDFFISNAGIITFGFASAIALIAYIFQAWHEGVFVRSERRNFSENLQPAAGKLLSKEENKKK
ncbi:MAG: hypothetical protein H6Q67_745 [Firmicutes bacterium]|nr:hypothetical protein [Bacillota bacterium]